MKKFANILTTCIQLSIATLAIIAASFCTSLGSHIVGGEITYQWISGNDYKIQLTYYSDCSGAPNPTTALIEVNSQSCSQSFSISLPIASGPDEISPICATSLSNSTCNGGTLYSVKRVVYEGVVSLNGPCNDWVFSYNECCRNAAITNLNSPSGFGSYFEATLNNLDVPFNNSVQFAGIPVNMIQNNTTSSLSWNTYDVDGDSLHYEMVAPRDYVGLNPVNIAFNSGLTAAQPFIASIPTLLNSQTGILTISPNALQVTVMSMKISEFRNGINIGNVYRDYQFKVINTSNALPKLSGINGNNIYTTNTCPGDTLQFNVISTDADPFQILDISLENNGTSASLSTTSAQYPVGTFTWTPSTTDISSQPYIFTLKVNDDNCDYYGTQTFSYQIYVNGCNTNDVWPGDANSDGVANLYDLLSVGIGFNTSGTSRVGASTGWVAQPSVNWPNSFLSGINYKHADTDGNGIIDWSDTTAIFLNYGLNHPLRTAPPAVAGLADLTITASADTIGTSMLLDFNIDITSYVDSIYGLAFRMYLDPALVDITTLQTNYTGSFWGTSGTDMVKLDYNTGNGLLDIAISRIDHTNISGGGPVGKVTIVTTDNVSGKMILNVSPFDIVGVTASGDEINFNSFGDAVVIDQNFTGINEHNLSPEFSVYPIPASELIFVEYFGQNKLLSVEIEDVNGRNVMIMNNPVSKQQINVHTLNKGVYFIKATNAFGTSIKKLMIF
ncbi:MAG: T9SS type A sorting domain-containing protein [Bacteroidia bacterium]|nr:T9SS type A sorting domain-containing protein [Bacteroidota bacterium]MBP9081471.1 T9SS type A sorting domain-containing protein [Bacteroidia bacterium]